MDICRISHSGRHQKVDQFNKANVICAVPYYLAKYMYATSNQWIKRSIADHTLI